MVDSTAGRVVLVDAFNRVLSEKTGLRTPLGIAVDAAGNIYLGEAGAGCVTVFDSQWNPLYQLGAGPGEFQLPSYIAIDPGTTPATVYVSDSPANTLKAYRNGTLVRTLGGPGSRPTGFNFPAGVWVNGAGDVFAADQNYQRVLVFTRDGAFLRAFLLGPSGALGSMGRPAGITGDAEGRVYVADTFQDYVKVFDEQGTLLASISGYGAGPGQVRSPAGIALDPQRRLLVASPNTGRVEVFGLDCFTQLAATPASQTAPVGATVTFSALPACPGPFTFQWRKGTNNLTDGGVVSGATNATLMLTGVTAGDAGTYSVAITGPDGTLFSPEARLADHHAAGHHILPDQPLRGAGLDHHSDRGGDGQRPGLALVLQRPRTLHSQHQHARADQSPILGRGQVLGCGLKLRRLRHDRSGHADRADPALHCHLARPTKPSPEYGTATFSVVAGGSAPLRYQWYLGRALLASQTNATLVLTNVSPGRATAATTRRSPTPSGPPTAEPPLSP